MTHTHVTLSGATFEVAESKGLLRVGRLLLLHRPTNPQGILRLASLAPKDKPHVTLSGAAFEAAESKGLHRVGRTLLSSSSL